MTSGHCLTATYPVGDLCWRINLGAFSMTDLGPACVLNHGLDDVALKI